MNKLWTLGFALFVLGGCLLLAAVVGGFIALPGCLLWWPGEVQELRWHVVGTMVFAMVLSVAGCALAKFSEKKGE
ncbi:MAG: hypothetical protein IJN23_03640 [Akkermansia sp.]|nr:hypothetical protein [Akkermansia sp.]